MLLFLSIFILCLEVFIFFIGDKFLELFFEIRVLLEDGIEVGIERLLCNGWLFFWFSLFLFFKNKSSDCEYV